MMNNLAADTPAIDAEGYDDPEMEDGAEVEVEAPKGDAWLIANANEINLAKMIDDTHLTRIGAKVVEEFLIDEDSRVKAGWVERHTNALKQAMQVKEAKNYPWAGASNVKYPLTTVAAIQFAARAYPDIVDGANVVKGKVLGKPDEEKRARADRIGRHMSYQLLDEMDEWEGDTDKMLHILPVTGSVFRKTYYDPMKGRPCSEMITADKLVINYWAKHDPERVTQVCEYYPREITGKIRSGLWIEQDLGRPVEANSDDDAPHTFLEQHRMLDLDEDGYPEPYIVTVHKETQKVVRIYARYDEDGIKANEKGEVYCITPVRYFTHYPFMPSMDNSYYGIGFGTLLDPLNETINSTLNQLMDAGHLANTQGGFMASELKMRSGNVPLKPGEFRRVENTSGQALKDCIVELPTSGPSTVLFQLLGQLIDVSKDITATKDILTGETGQANAPVGTTLAMIEQGLKVFSAIYKRIHRSLKQELACLFRLNCLYLEPEVYFNFQDEEGKVGLDDYEVEDVGVMPVSDPTVVTDMQRIGRAQYLGQFLGKGWDDVAIMTRMLEAGGIQDIEGLKPKAPPGPDPKTVEAMAKAENEKRKLDQQDIKLSHDAALNESQISVNAAQAQNIMTDALLKAPQFQLQIEQYLDRRIAEMMAPAEGPQNGQAPPVQQGNPGGMAGPAPDPNLPPVPEGPPEQLGEPMDAGDPNVTGGPDGGPAAVEAVGPGLG